MGIEKAVLMVYYVLRKLKGDVFKLYFFCKFVDLYFSAFWDLNFFAAADGNSEVEVGIIVDDYRRHDDGKTIIKDNFILGLAIFNLFTVAFDINNG